MTLEEIRRQIDALDLEIRNLVMRRMDMSRAVAECKKRTGDTAVYRPEREREILTSLGEGVPKERRDAYLAVVRSILRGSRGYQYDLFYGWDPGAAEELFGDLRVPEGGHGVRLKLKCPDRPGALAAVLSLVGDIGCDLAGLVPLGRDEAGKYAGFELKVLCDMRRPEIRKLMYRLSMETRDFEILEVFGPEGRPEEEKT